MAASCVALNELCLNQLLPVCPVTKTQQSKNSVENSWYVQHLVDGEEFYLAKLLTMQGVK